MSNKEQVTSSEIDIAQKTRKACIEAAREAFRDASMRGLCSDGAIEAAIGAMQSLDVKKIVADTNEDD